MNISNQNDNLIKKLEQTELWKTQKVDNWTVLMEEWDIDTNIYIVKSWIIEVRKKISETVNRVIKLAELEKWQIFWEWALFWSEPKKVQLKANWDTILFKIAWTKIEELKNNHPDIVFKFYEEIIKQNLQRVLKWNTEIENLQKK